MPARLSDLTRSVLSATAANRDEFVIAPACLYRTLAALSYCSLGETHDEIAALVGDADEIAATVRTLAADGASDSCARPAAAPGAGDAPAPDDGGAPAVDDGQAPEPEGASCASDPAAAAAPGEGGFSLACSLWADSSVSLRPGFERGVEVLGDRVYNYDLHSERAEREIGRWLLESTGGDYDQASEISPACFLLALGAQHVSDAWREPFTDARVKKFHAPDGNYKVEYMVCWQECHVVERAGSVTLSKRLESGARVVFSMPDESMGVQDYVADGMAWKNVCDCFERPKKAGVRQLVRLAVPRVTLGTEELRLVDTLKELGVQHAFNPLIADFSPMSSSPLSVGALALCSTLDLNPRGVDGVGRDDVGQGGGKRPNARKVMLNRPFVFALITAGGCPLFAGTFSHPTEA